MNVDPGSLASTVPTVQVGARVGIFTPQRVVALFFYIGTGKPRRKDLLSGIFSHIQL